MVETVSKSSGMKEPFDEGKIEQAVTKAAQEAGAAAEDIAESVRAVVSAVASNAGDRTSVASSEIRDWALAALDEKNASIADAWRAFDERKGE